MLTEQEVETIKKLILTNKEAEAVELLVRLTGCDTLDAKYLVEDYDGIVSFEALLDKYWIEKPSQYIPQEDIPLTSKEKFNVLKIFLPMFILILFTIILIVYSINK